MGNERKITTNDILKKGYIPKAIEIDFNNPEIKKQIAKTIHQQEEIVARKEIDWERLQNTYITI